MNQTVTPADHDAGFKDLEVVKRNGERKTIRLTAPSYRQAQKLTLQLQQSKDAVCITAACLNPESGTRNPEQAEAFLNSLTIESAALIETAAFALTFGSDFQKKMEAMGERIQQAMASTDSAPKWPLSLPDFPPGKSADIHCPSCNCTIVLSGNTTLAGTSAESGPAPQAA